MTCYIILSTTEMDKVKDRRYLQEVLVSFFIVAGPYIPQTFIVQEEKIVHWWDMLNGIISGLLSESMQLKTTLLLLPPLFLLML